MTQKKTKYDVKPTTLEYVPPTEGTANTSIELPKNESVVTPSSLILTYKMISESNAYLTYGDSILIEVKIADSLYPNPSTTQKILILPNEEAMLKDSLVPITCCLPINTTYKIRVINFNRTPKRITKGSVVATAVIIL